jgi:4-carboxymuconolactone decarboxylase
LVALTLNAFEIGLPEAFAPELGGEPGDAAP